MVNVTALPPDIIFFFTCTSITTFLGIPVNLLVLIFLTCGSRLHCHLSRLIFLFIVATDLTFSVCISVFTVQFLTGVSIYSHKNQALCEVIELTFDTVSRYIYFLMSLLAVIRARAILDPLGSANLSVKVFRGILLGTLGMFVTISLFPVVMRQTNSVAFCGGKLEHSFPKKTVRVLWVAIGTLLPVSLSVVIMVCSNFVSLYHLLVPQRGGSKLFKVGGSGKAKAAKTTIVLTTVFFCLHVTGLLKSWSQILPQLDVGIGGYYANGIMVLSCVIDPFVYFLKTPEVWRFWRRCWNKGIFNRAAFSKLSRSDLRRKRRPCRYRTAVSPGSNPLVKRKIGNSHDAFLTLDSIQLESFIQNHAV